MRLGYDVGLAMMWWCVVPRAWAGKRLRGVLNDAGNEDMANEASYDELWMRTRNKK